MLLLLVTLITHQIPLIYDFNALITGQTGAGKTYTMIGPSKGINARDKNLGLIPKSLEYLYSKFEHAPNISFKIRLSCLEIYQEHVYDLFAEDRERTPMSVREHATEGFFLEGARLVECSTYPIACSVLDVAFANRQVGNHDLNSRSSRSHCLTEVFIECNHSNHSEHSAIDAAETNPELLDTSTTILRGKMSLVDLAGSERLKSTNSTGKVLQEAGFINRSLYILGKVIAGLVRTNGDLNHKDVPYRDSKLTKLLISSLGGSSRSLLIACVSEAKGSQAETLRTLKFSMSCARIRNRPVRFLDPQERLIHDLKDEIKRLRNENRQLRTTILTAPAGQASESMIMSVGSGGNGDMERRAQSAEHRMSPHKQQQKATSQSPQKLRRMQYQQQQIQRKQHRLSPIKAKQSNLQQHNKQHQKQKKKPEIYYKYPPLSREDDDDLTVMMMRMEEEQQYLLNHRQQQAEQQQGGGSPSSFFSSPARNQQAPAKPAAAAAVVANKASPSPSIVSHANKQPVAIRSEMLEELVHRRSVGPMVFRDKTSPIAPVTSTHAKDGYTGNNYDRAIEVIRIKHLEDRIAKMEKMQQNSPSRAQQRQDRQQQQYEVDQVEQGNEEEEEPLSKTRVNSIAVDGSSLLREQDKKKAKKQANAKKAKSDRLSVYMVGSELLPAGKFVKKQQSEAEKNLAHKPQPRLPPSVRASESNANSKNSKTNNAAVSNKKQPQSLPQLLPAAHSSNSSVVSSSGRNNKNVKPQQQANSSSSASKLPAVANNKQSAAVARPSGVTAASSGNSRDLFPPMQLSEEVAMDNNSTVTSARLRGKLDELKRSLTAKRMEMEDSPGDVTTEMEAKFRSMQIETMQITDLLNHMSSGPVEDSDIAAMMMVGNSKSSSQQRSPVIMDPVSNDSYGSSHRNVTAEAIITAKQQQSLSSKPQAAEEEDEYSYHDDDFEADSPHHNPSNRHSPQKKEVEKVIAEYNVFDDVFHDDNEEERLYQQSKIAAEQTANAEPIAKTVVPSPSSPQPIKQQSPAKIEPIIPPAAVTKPKAEDEDDYGYDLEFEDHSSPTEPQPQQASPVAVPASKSPVAPAVAAAIQPVSSAKRSRTPGKRATTADKSGDDGYGEDFDDYDVSFED